MLVTSTFAKLQRPEPELGLLVAALHPHGAHGRVQHQVRGAHREVVLAGLVERAVEQTGAPREVVRPQLAGGVVVAVDVLAGQLLQGALRVLRVLRQAGQGGGVLLVLLGEGGGEG